MHSLAYVQYMYSTCTVYVRFRSVHILYIYCTSTVHMPLLVYAMHPFCTLKYTVKHQHPQLAGL